jgi:pimeloyl-ACP methyl ester carboxylesterase
MAGRLFFTPPRTRIRDEEYAVLAHAGTFSLHVRGERVSGYTWGDGPPVLLVHGWGGHAAHMTAFVKPLTQAGFRAVALDMPGHGQSGGRLSSLVHFAAAIKAAGEHFGPLQGLIAHSLGAAGATAAMARGLNVERAVFFAPLARFGHIWSRFREGLAIPDRVWLRFVEDSERWLKVRFEDIEPVALAGRMTAPLLVLHDPQDSEIPFERARRWRATGRMPRSMPPRTPGTCAF